MNSPRRVGVNLLWLVPAVVGGSEEYATRLLRAVAKTEHDDIEIVLFALESFARAHPDLTNAFETRVLRLDGRLKPLRVLAESSWLARHTRRFDLMHHMGGRIPLVSPVTRNVVTIHDLQPLEHPENFSRVKRIFLARALPRSARRARLVMTASEYVRQHVVDRLHVPLERTVAVPAPVEPRSATPSASRDAPARLAPLIEGTVPYFLYPVITYRHKNHRVLLDAFALLHADHPEVRLVLTGGPGDAEDDVRAAIGRLGLDKAVIRTSRIERPVLDALIDRATAVVFPSRFEGFGLAVIEALAAGCPVIAANATALPEVVGGAGVLVDVDDVGGWTRAMAAQLDAPREAGAAVRRERAAAFAPAVCAQRLLDAYRAALA